VFEAAEIRSQAAAGQSAQRKTLIAGGNASGLESITISTLKGSQKI
jgi:hypothetical protein